MSISLAGPVPRTGVRAFALPLVFLATGVVSFVALSFLFAAGAAGIQAFYFRNKFLLFITHLFTLGYVTAVIMGAMYQLVPVVLETPPPSRRSGFWQYGLFLAGLLTMLVGFDQWRPAWIAGGGTVMLASVCLFVWNIAAVMRQARGRHITGTFLVLSLAYLVLVATWGVLLAFNLMFGYFGAGAKAQLVTHVALGFAGWFTNTIIGVSYRLIPLFTLAHLQPGAISRAVLVLLNLGVAGLAVGAGLGAPAWVPALSLGAMAAAFGLYMADTHRMIRSRVRKELDISVRYAAAATVFLLLALAGAAWLLLAPGAHANGRYVAVMVALSLGWVSLMVCGQMYKILPFLVWTGRYAPRAGREKVPMLREMYSERLARWSYAALLAGVTLATAGLWFGWLPVTYAGSYLTAAGAALFGYGMWQVLTR